METKREPSIKVFDLPTRLFHWSFVGLFISAFTIAQLVDDKSPTFSVHMLLGIALFASVLFRIVWAFLAGPLGSTYAGIRAFNLSPRQLWAYLSSIFSSNAKRTLRRNPGSSWAALTMLLLALGLGITGYLMTSVANKEVFEEIHEVMANALVLVALTHFIGLVLHTLRHRDRIGLSMITGQKQAVAGEQGIRRSYWPIGILYLVFMASVVTYLNKRYEPTTHELRIFGQVLQLGDKKESSGKKGAERLGTKDHHDDHEKNDENH